MEAKVGDWMTKCPECRAEFENKIANKLEAELNSIKRKPKKPKKHTNDDFELFWQAYPKKRSKGQAQQTWVKLKKQGALPELAVLQKAVAAAGAIHDWKRDDGQFIPYASTWLNAEGWKDVYGTAKVEKVDSCFVCRQPAVKEIPTGSGGKDICKVCSGLLDAAPNFMNHQDKVIPKRRLLAGQLEDMILKQKAK